MLTAHNDAGPVERTPGRTTYGPRFDFREDSGEVNVYSETHPESAIHGEGNSSHNTIKVVPGAYGSGAFRRGLSKSAFVCSLAFGWVLSGGAVSTADELSTDRILTVGLRLPDDAAPVVTAVAIDSSGHLAATAGDDHLVRLWNADSCKLVRELRGHTDWVRAVAFDPRGASLASASDDHLIKFWNVETGEALHTLAGDNHPVLCLTYSPDGKILIAGGFDGKLRLFHSETGEPKCALECPGVEVRTLAVSPDGRLLAAAGRNGTIRVWRISDCKHLRDIDADRLRVRAICFSPDSRRLASGGDDRRLRVWNIDTGVEACTLSNKCGRIHSLVFCDDDLLAAGTTDNSICLWDLARTTERLQMVGHSGSIAALAYNSASRSLLSGSFDTTARIWKLPAALSTTAVAEPNE